MRLGHEKARHRDLSRKVYDPIGRFNPPDKRRPAKWLMGKNGPSITNAGVD